MKLRSGKIYDPSVYYDDSPYVEQRIVMRNPDTGIFILVMMNIMVIPLTYMYFMMQQ